MQPLWEEVRVGRAGRPWGGRMVSSRLSPLCPGHGGGDGGVADNSLHSHVLSKYSIIHIPAISMIQQRECMHTLSAIVLLAQVWRLQRLCLLAKYEKSKAALLAIALFLTSLCWTLTTLTRAKNVFLLVLFFLHGRIGLMPCHCTKFSQIVECRKWKKNTFWQQQQNSLPIYLFPHLLYLPTTNRGGSW